MTQHFNRAEDKAKRRNLRRQMPPAERLLWSKLRNRQLRGLRFRRQYSIGPYVIDFYCPKIKLGIELDGETHYLGEAQQYDRQRQQFIESFGVRLLRFLNDEVRDNIDGVWEAIARVAERRIAQTNH